METGEYFICTSHTVSCFDRWIAFFNIVMIHQQARQAFLATSEAEMLGTKKGLQVTMMYNDDIGFSAHLRMIVSFVSCRNYILTHRPMALL
jgi:hypothetical protein